MKTKLLAMMLLAGGSMFAQTRFSIGLGFGSQGAGFYQAPPAYASDIPPCPGPGYTWIDGYWTNEYGRENWVAGYWSAPPVFTGYQVAPRFDNHFGDRDDRRFDNHFGDRDNRQSFSRASQPDRGRSFDQRGNFNSQNRNQSHENSKRSNGGNNRQGR
jgi:YXWGXW repeat-containing protein